MLADQALWLEGGFCPRSLEQTYGSILGRNIRQSRDNVDFRCHQNMVNAVIANILLDLGKKEVCDTFSRDEMILTKILRAADHPYLMGKGGRMVIQIIIIKITVTKMIFDDGNKGD